jgi:hypothetical protein
MRLYCWFCGKSVSSELDEDVYVGAILVCPECIEKERIIIPHDKKGDDNV